MNNLNYELNCLQIVSDTERLLRAHYHVALKDAKGFQIHAALGQAVQMAIAEKWDEDEMLLRSERRAAYISAEFLLGRLWHNNLVCLGIYDEIEQLMAVRGACLADMEDIEDAALGNGGLGRLAACYMDAAATQEIPLTGYGLYYRFGLFRQEFKDSRQNEKPDDWTGHGDPWSVRREDEAVIVDFPPFSVRAVPYDMPVIGYKGAIRTLRLWRAESIEPIDMPAFNAQKYDVANFEANRAADLTTLLYPGDSERAGKILRLRQQYLMCSATMQDLLRQCPDHTRFAEFNAIQLNDTHPVMAIPELIRLLMGRGMGWDAAVRVAYDTFSYTNHTVMPEALECWTEDLMSEVAPALIPIIRRLDERCRAHGEEGLFIVHDGNIHMANLAVYATHCTNGVAEIHSGILKEQLFKDWHRVYPSRLTNVTNGVTQRRWLKVCNRELTDLVAEKIGSDAFLKDLSLIGELREHIDEDTIRRFREIKQEKKKQLAAYVLRHEGVELPCNFLFDVQVKRLHEYKRQLMNALSLVDIYYQLKEDENFRNNFTPTCVIFGAKAAAGYARAKSVIYFCNELARKINTDPVVRDYLRVVFVQNYNCSYAERIIPAADISQQISPAGTEASGTGNMKLMLNGAVTLGTMDGANIEIVEQAGIENEYIFGATKQEIIDVRDHHDPMKIYNENPRLKRAVDSLIDGFVMDSTGGLKELHESLLQGASWHRPDHHFLLLDFASYQEARLRAYADYKNDPDGFARKCLLNVAGAGKFSADRSVKEYAENIWRV